MRTEDDGAIIVLKSTEDWYEVERSGAKPNTVRIVDNEEWNAIRQADKVRIVLDRHVGNEDTFFEREITYRASMGILLGRRLVIICWRA